MLNIQLGELLQLMLYIILSILQVLCMHVFTRHYSNFKLPLLSVQAFGDLRVIL